MSVSAKARAGQEIAYCEKILAKSRTNVLLKTLPKDGPVTWKHYPEHDTYDPQSGAQWYYHSHDNSEKHGEHGHFHCFVRPEGKESPPCHLIALGVDAHGRLSRIFTVNQWVTGGQWYDAQSTNTLLDRFNIEMAEPDYIVNRWLTATVTYYETEITRLNLERDHYIASLEKEASEIWNDRTIEVLSELIL